MSMSKTEKLDVKEVYRCLQIENEEDRKYFRQLARVGQKRLEEEEDIVTYTVTQHNTQMEENDA